MFDARLRRRFGGGLEALARAVDRPWITPDGLTLTGLVVGLGSAGLAAAQWWWWSLAAWLLSRVLDGVDGPLARRRGRTGSAAGGFLDITSDFVVYGATVIGVAVGVTPASASPGDWLPFAAVLLAYYVNGAAFLAFSSLAERTGKRIEDGRSLSFLGGLTEGAETIVVHAAWLILPQYAADIALVWAALVSLSAVHRIVTGYRVLREPGQPERPGKPEDPGAPGSRRGPEGVPPV
ncbi:CDP-alcohol phosphatidyltransferase family protein [Serinibacter salmoneus]|uniref:Phosphatidylglycerophosphate synthase n=1 Tax=Serinibacter salmoneus TaxID=556530 RepID=A0A2A9CXI5_9MICO|nr:CDP-alcohol phosphatidyltransferase family protein [Serinibacter salmoneus]PFG19148.1 phosphatidylglycerophosphate synthase [Serinibacter salmoneus]